MLCHKNFYLIAGHGACYFICVILSFSVQAFDPATFKKPSDEELKEKLTKLQYEVTQEDKTERPFKNSYNDLKAEGIYVDVVSGEPLFSSQDKYDSGTGWPSFTKPISEHAIIKKKDSGLFGARNEIRSKHGNSHLGHVFNDGPPSAGGKRYCTNSASLRFIPRKDLKKEGYGEYEKLFSNNQSLQSR